MKHIVRTLGLAWAFLWLLACASSPSREHKPPQTWQGDRTGNVYVEMSPGFVRNLGTGEMNTRVGKHWIQDEKGNMHFIYGGNVEERR